MAARGIVSVVIVLVLVAIGAAAWMISSNLHNGTASDARPQSTQGTGPAPASTRQAAQVLKPVSASAYNAYNPTGDEDGQKAPLAIDGNPSSAWTTQWYSGNPVFGGYKPGTGLLLDMGKPVTLSQVEVSFSSACCTSADLYLGNTSTVSQAAFGTFTKVASGARVSGDYKYNTSGSAKGRYVLIWITSLPPSLPGSGSPSGTFEEQVYEVTVRGKPVSAAG
jgi:hypothetical protein